MEDRFSTESAEPDPASAVAHFGYEVKPAGPAAVRVTVTGELDLLSAPVLEAELSAIEQDVTVVILDLSGLAFMDSTGLHLLVRTETRLRESNQRLKLVHGGPQIKRLFRLTGLESQFEFLPSGTADAARTT